MTDPDTLAVALFGAAGACEPAQRRLMERAAALITDQAAEIARLQNRDSTDLGAIRARLADYSHNSAWAGWMRYQFRNGTHNEDGTWTMPGWAVERWTRQMNTPYAELSEQERQSDLKEADEMIAIAGIAAQFAEIARLRARLAEGEEIVAEAVVIHDRHKSEIAQLRVISDQLYGACKSDLEAFNRIVALVDDIRNGADLYNMLDLIIDLASMPAARAALATGRRAETAALLERTGM